MTYKQDPEIKSSKLYTNGAIGFSGPPGTGKSIIGKLIAKELNMPFFDLDDLIAKKAGVKTTKKIINNNGLPKFKQIQHSCFKEVFRNNDQEYILSFGGHTTYPDCDPELIAKNKTLVKEHLFNICLIPSDDINEIVDILWPRQNDGKRETGSNTSDQYRLYVQNLSPQYIKTADLVVFTHNASIDDIATIILNELKK
ncbi:AAA family ATPase [Candidatus Peregrinibacteria bacterium]|nr:AAA family ATPase [Candidatus Peregrinibacteria bacterium]